MAEAKSVSPVRVVLVTAPDTEVAAGIAGALVSEGLAACGNVLPGLTSIYRWEGEIHRDPEALLVLKTQKGRVEALIRRIGELHPYDVPEVLSLAVEEGLPAYLSWVESETSP
ncbi:MAG: divalent-cation tolerance protein CutA [Gemmatimonadales bacterium]|nr:MAG: divalent-cation tolerance protein CutA [Gemmatimonadales bacterium]